MAVEFSRSVTFGQYLDLRSPVHRLDPRTKMAAFGLLLVTLFLIRGFAGFGVVLVLVAIVQATSRIPLGYTLRGMRLLLTTLSIILVFQIVFYPNPRPDTIWWQWGPLSLSGDGLRQGGLILVRVVLLYYLTTTLMFTTPLTDLAAGLEKTFSPLKSLLPINELVMTLVIAIKFVPLLVAELERLVKAQAARGVALDQGGFVQRTRKLVPLLVPLFVNAFGRAEVVTQAMNARCYRGGAGRTTRRLLQFRPTDGLALLLVAGMCVVAWWLDRLILI